MELEDNIKHWVSIDNQVKLLQSKMKALKEERGRFQNAIINYVETNELNHATIKISDGKLKFNQNRITTPLTFKFVRLCLSECIDKEEYVDQLINYIKEKREIRYVPDIKRYYDKKN